MLAHATNLDLDTDNESAIKLTTASADPATGNGPVRFKDDRYSIIDNPPYTQHALALALASLVKQQWEASKADKRTATVHRTEEERRSMVTACHVSFSATFPNISSVDQVMQWEHRYQKLLFFNENDVNKL